MNCSTVLPCFCSSVPLFFCSSVLPILRSFISPFLHFSASLHLYTSVPRILRFFLLSLCLDIAFLLYKLLALYRACSVPRLLCKLCGLCLTYSVLPLLRTSLILYLHCYVLSLLSILQSFLLRASISPYYLSSMPQPLSLCAPPLLLYFLHMIDRTTLTRNHSRPLFTKFRSSDPMNCQPSVVHLNSPFLLPTSLPPYHYQSQPASLQISNPSYLCQPVPLKFCTVAGLYRR